MTYKCRFIHVLYSNNISKSQYTVEASAGVIRNLASDCFFDLVGAGKMEDEAALKSAVLLKRRIKNMRADRGASPGAAWRRVCLSPLRGGESVCLSLWMLRLPRASAGSAVLYNSVYSTDLIRA